MTAPTMATRLWTVRELAAYLQVSVSWVHHKLADDDLPRIRIGKLVRFSPEQITAWLERGDLAAKDRP